MPTERTVDFYNVDDEARHGFGDIDADRDALRSLLATEAPHGDELVLEVGCGVGLGHPRLVRHLPGRSAHALRCPADGKPLVRSGNTLTCGSGHQSLVDEVPRLVAAH